MNAHDHAFDYSVAREQIQSGDVLLFEGGGDAWSRLIRWRTGSTITHCGIAWRTLGRVLVIEALVEPGVVVLPLSRRIDRGARVWWHSLAPTIDGPAVVAHALEQWGEPYSSAWQFVRSFGLPRRLSAWLPGPADVDGGARWFCSELVLASLYRGGYVPEQRRPAATVAPADLVFLDCLERRGRLARPVFRG